VTYTTAGDPDLPRSAEILKALDRAGADVLEVGVPFSGSARRRSGHPARDERAIASGGSLGDPAMIAKVRRRFASPIVIFSYANPMLRLAWTPLRARPLTPEWTACRARPADRRGRRLRETLASARHRHDLLLSRRRTDARIRTAAALAAGFLYGISRLE